MNRAGGRAGHLTMELLVEATERWPGVWGRLAERLGTSNERLGGLVKAGEVSIAELAAAMEAEEALDKVKAERPLAAYPACRCGHRYDAHRSSGDPRGDGCWECECTAYDSEVAP